MLSAPQTGSQHRLSQLSIQVQASPTEEEDEKGRAQDRENEAVD